VNKKVSIIDNAQLTLPPLVDPGLMLSPALAVGGGALSDTAIRPSVCPSLGYSTLAAWRSCLGYLHGGCLQLAGHQRCVDCGPVRGRT